MFKLIYKPNAIRKAVELNFEREIGDLVLDHKGKKIEDSVILKSFVNEYKDVKYKIIYVAFKNADNDLYCVYSINDVDGSVLLIDSIYDIKSENIK